MASCASRQLTAAASASRVTVKAEHRPLSPVQKEEPALVAGLEADRRRGRVLVDPARRTLAERGEGLERLAQVVEELQESARERKPEEQKS